LVQDANIDIHSCELETIISPKFQTTADLNQF